MAKVVLIQDLAEFQPSITNVIISTMLGEKPIDRFYPDKVYQPTDRVYIIKEGDIIVMECINNNVTTINDVDWIILDSGIGGNSTSQNPNSYQNISYFENKLVTDVNVLASRVNSILSLDNQDLTNMHMVPMYEQSELNIVSGRFEFGRMFI